MKKLIKRILAVSVMVMLAVCCVSCSAMAKYKRISLQAEPLGDVSERNEMLARAKVDNLLTETFSDVMPVYKIVPREISPEEFLQFATDMGIQAEADEINIYPDSIGGAFIDKAAGYCNCPFFTDGYNHSCRLNLTGNHISGHFYVVGETEYGVKMTDAELEQTAREIFNCVSFIKEEYEYLGITSTQIAYASEDESYVDTVRVSFRRVIDGTRVIGNDIFDLYFDAYGLNGIQIRLYDYEKIDEISMMPLKEAVRMVKTPDALSISKISETDADFTGKVDTMKIERAKLLFVNQHADGCEILQPVYNLMGTIENGTEKAKFSARIIAIPEKYTYE